MPAFSSANDRGMALYRERRYDAALAEFLAAARLNPTSALVANNVGFTYYRLGRHDDAVTWFQKTIAIDPGRAVAYANLGDALLALNQTEPARRAFEKHLELQPTSRLAPSIRQKLAGLAGEVAHGLQPVGISSARRPGLPLAASGITLDRAK